MMAKSIKISIYWIVGILVAAVLPHVVNSVMTNLLVTFMMEAVFALTVNLLLGFTGLLSFGQAMFFGLGGYATALTLNHITGFPLLGALFMSGLAGLLLGCIVAPLLARAAGTAFSMLTLALGQLIYVICLKFREVTGGEDGITNFAIPPIDLGFVSIAINNHVNFYYFALIVLGLLTFVMWWLTKTPFGTVLIDIRDNPLRVEYLGYRIKHTKAVIIIISGTIAGFVGGVYALFHNMVSTDGVLTVFISFFPLMASYIGGMGSFFGPILGVGILHILNEITSRFTQRIDLINGIVFIIVVIYAPMGAIGIWWSIKARLFKSKPLSEKEAIQ